MVTAFVRSHNVDAVSIAFGEHLRQRYGGWPGCNSRVDKALA